MSTRRIIKGISKKSGVPKRQVIADIKAAIRVGMASTDPETQAFWKQIAPDGKEPTIDEFLNYFANNIHI